MRILRFLLAALLAPAGAAAAATDPIEGRWHGEAGSPRERIQVWLEFRRGEDGRLRVALTQPVANYFALDPGGEVKREGDRVVVESLFLDLTLQGDELRGHYPGPKSPATFRRTRGMPGDAEPPALPPGPEPRWHTRLNGQVRASPVVHDGMVYVGSSGGVFNAVNGRDGSLAWTFAPGCAIHGAAAVDAESVWFACDETLFALERTTGKERWRYALGAAPRVLPHPQVFEWDWQAPAPLVADGTLFLGDGAGVLHALDAASGARRWRFAARGAIRTSAALHGERVLFGSHDHFVYALDRTTGREAWRHDTGAHVDTAPVPLGDRVLIGNRGPGLFSLDAATGTLAWRLFFWGSWIESTPVAVDGTIYIGASDLRRVSAIDPADGRVLWRTDVFGWTFGTPLVVGDRIHVGAAGGTPYMIRHRASYSVLDRSSGRLLRRRELPDTGGHQWGITGSLAQVGDLVVYATLAGSLYGVPLE